MRNISTESLEKTVEKLDEERKRHNIAIEEWPQLPHGNWKWKLSNPAKELEAELNALIWRFLRFRVDVKEDTGAIVPLPKVLPYYFKEDHNGIAKLDLMAVRLSVLVHAKSNASRKEFIKRGIKRISRHIRRAVWNYLHLNKDKVSMRDYTFIFYLYPEAFGMTKTKRSSLASIIEREARLNELSTAPGSAKFIIEDRPE